MPEQELYCSWTNQTRERAEEDAIDRQMLKKYIARWINRRTNRWISQHVKKY